MARRIQARFPARNCLKARQNLPPGFTPAASERLERTLGKLSQIDGGRRVRTAPSFRAMLGDVVALIDQLEDGAADAPRASAGLRGVRGIRDRLALCGRRVRVQFAGRCDDALDK